MDTLLVLNNGAAVAPTDDQQRITDNGELFPDNA